MSLLTGHAHIEIFVLLAHRRPGVEGLFAGAKMTVVAGVAITMFRPLGDVAVNRAAVRPSCSEFQSDKNQQSNR